MRFRSCVAVAVVQAGSYSSDLTPSLGTSMCRRWGPKNQNNNNNNKTKITNKVQYREIYSILCNNLARKRI